MTDTKPEFYYIRGFFQSHTCLLIALCSNNFTELRIVYIYKCLQNSIYYVIFINSCRNSHMLPWSLISLSTQLLLPLQLEPFSPHLTTKWLWHFCRPQACVRDSHGHHYPPSFHSSFHSALHPPAVSDAAHFDQSSLAQSWS